MNNIACLVLTALPRVQVFWRFLMKYGKVKHSPFFSLSVSSFVSLYLIIQLKYHENYGERLRTRQVNWMLIMKSSNIFRARHFNSCNRWRNTSFMRLIKVFRCRFWETIPIFFNRLKSCLISLSFTSDWIWKEFVKMQFQVKSISLWQQLSDLNLLLRIPLRKRKVWCLANSLREKLKKCVNLFEFKRKVSVFQTKYISNQTLYYPWYII